MRFAVTWLPFVAASWILVTATPCAAVVRRAPGPVPVVSAVDDELLPVEWIGELHDLAPPLPPLEPGPLWTVVDGQAVSQRGVALPSRSWSGQVLDEDGRPVNGAGVRVLPNGAAQVALGVLPAPFREFVGLGWTVARVPPELLERLPEVSTDEDGRYHVVVPHLPMDRDFGEFKLGRWEPLLWATAPEHSSVCRELEPLELESNGLAPLLLPRAERPTAGTLPTPSDPVSKLRGRVVDAAGQPLAGVPVRAGWAEHGYMYGNTCTPGFLEPDAYTQRMVFERGTSWTLSGADGRFACDLPLEDDWSWGEAPPRDVTELRFDVSGYQPGAAATLVREVRVGYPLELVLQPAARLAVDLVDSEGAPLTATRVRAFAQTGLPGEEHPLLVTPGDVAHRFVVHEASQLETRLLIDPADGPSLAVSVEGVPVARVGRTSVVVPATRSLAVWVTDDLGRRLPDALVRVRRYCPGRRAHLIELALGVSDGDGVASLQDLPRQDLVLDLSAEGHGRQTVLVTDEARQRVVLQRVVSLVVFAQNGVGRPLRGKQITVRRMSELSGVDGPWQFQSTDEQGIARFEGLAPGTWTVSGGGMALETELSPAESHEVQLGPPRRGT